MSSSRAACGRCRQARSADIPVRSNFRAPAGYPLSTGRASLVTASALVWFAASAAEPEKESKEATPPVATSNPLGDFQVKRGFRIELVASETLVSAPVAMAFDENGRLFVAEMRDEPGRPEQHKPPGRVRLLEDTDGDGVFDASAVFADELPSASAVACYGGGVFVAAARDILYLKDTKGNRVADVRKVVFSGFGATTNTTGAPTLLNSFNWGLDNRIHGATAGIGGEITAEDATGAGPISVAGSDFSFDPRALTLSAEAGPAQSGLAFDNRGQKFVSDVKRSLRVAMYQHRYAARNPFFPRPPPMIDELPPATPIFRFLSAEQVSPSARTPPPLTHSPALPPTHHEPTNPPIQSSVNPTIAQSTNPSAQRSVIAASHQSTNPLIHQSNLARGWLTNAHGCVIYRGNAFPSSYLDNAFIADPSAHIIHRVVLREHGLEWVATRAADEQNTEFLISRDSSFRPTQVINGPDGALYVADHRDGGNGGRIYRIVPENFKQPKLPKLGEAKTYDLVVAFTNLNGWHRDTAARLLYEKQDPVAARLLTNMVQNSRLGLARLHALRALDGLGALTEKLVRQALRDPDERVRVHGVLLSERFLQEGTVSGALWNQLRALAADPSLRVRYQLALTLGEIRRPEKPQVLAEILRANPEDRWLQTAALTSVPDDAPELLSALASDDRWGSSASGLAFLEELAALIGVKGQTNEVAAVLDFVERTGLAPQSVLMLLHSLGAGLHRAGSSLAEADPQNRLGRFYDQAITATVDDRLADPVRLAAIRLRGVSPYPLSGPNDLYPLLFGSGQSVAVQSAAIGTLGSTTPPRIFDGLLDRWQLMTPSLRQEAVAALLTCTNGVTAVLRGLESGIINRETDLGSAQVDFLRSHRDSDVRQRASRLFGSAPGRVADALLRFKPALRLKGDAPRGRGVFLARCAPCHKLGLEGHPLGPDLDDLKTLGREAVLSKILELSRPVSPDFTTYVIETKASESFVGLLSDENATTITLRQANGVQEVWPRGNLKSIQAQPWPLMPKGWAADLTPQDMADLLEHLLLTTTL